MPPSNMQAFTTWRNEVLKNGRKKLLAQLSYVDKR